MLSRPAGTVNGGAGPLPGPLDSGSRFDYPVADGATLELFGRHRDPPGWRTFPARSRRAGAPVLTGPPAAMARASGFAGRVAAVALGVVVGAVALEAAVRAFHPVSDDLWQWDPVIGTKLVPGLGRAVSPGIYDIPVEVNAEGFRDREHANPRDAGVRGIVLLGDSFVEAVQVPFRDSVAALLEEDLARRGERAEVVSLAVSGAGTAREYLALREYGLRHRPDLVLLFFVENDVSDNSRRLQGNSYMPCARISADGRLERAADGTPLFTEFDPGPKRGRITGMLRRRSMAWRFLRESLDRAPAVTEALYRLGLTGDPPPTFGNRAADDLGFFEIYRREPRPDWAEAWGVTEDLLLATRDLAAGAGADFAVVLVPAAWDVHRPTWEEVVGRIPELGRADVDVGLPSRRLSAFLGRNGIPVIDLFPAFGRETAAGRTLHIRGDNHWSVDGHRLAAETIVPEVLRLLGRRPLGPGAVQP